MSLLDFLNPLNAITDALTKAYSVHENAKNDRERLAAEVQIRNLEVRRDVIVAASVNDRWWSTRELIGKCVFLYVFKIIVWDTVLGWGVTPNPGEQVTFIVMTVIGFYFVSKGAETIANTIASSLSARRGEAGKK